MSDFETRDLSVPCSKVQKFTKFEVYTLLSFQHMFSEESRRHFNTSLSKSSESVQCSMQKACDAFSDMGQL